jgi:hypothetical protein
MSIEVTGQSGNTLLENAVPAGRTGRLGRTTDRQLHCAYNRGQSSMAGDRQ